MKELAGKSIVVTRAVEGGEALRRQLEALGARVLSVPSLRFEAASDLSAWHRALAECRSFTHIAFTSQIAVRYFADLSRGHPQGLRAWDAARKAAIGASTAEALRSAGLRCDLESRAAGGLAFAQELLEREGLGPAANLLLPASAIARPELGAFLEAASVPVTAVPVYETLPADPASAAPLLDALDAGERIDAVAFASPSALEFFLEMTGEPGRRLLAASATRIVAIGTTTARAIEASGFRTRATAARPGVDALVAAVVDAVSAQ